MPANRVAPRIGMIEAPGRTEDAHDRSRSEIPSQAAVHPFGTTNIKEAASRHKLLHDRGHDFAALPVAWPPVHLVAVVSLSALKFADRRELLV